MDHPCSRPVRVSKPVVMRPVRVIRPVRVNCAEHGGGNGSIYGCCPDGCTIPEKDGSFTCYKNQMICDLVN